jgi:hypothetical protein
MIRRLLRRALLLGAIVGALSGVGTPAHAFTVCLRGWSTQPVGSHTVCV